MQPPSIPTASSILREDVRSIWYSLSESVWLGATTMESPVWIPTGSMFSMLHTVMQFPLLSLITSYSTSFQPFTLFSRSTWPIVLSMSPDASMVLSESSFSAIPPPEPPSVYAGLTITGYPTLAAQRSPESRSVIISLSITGWSISFIISLKSSLSSPFLIESIDVPITFTPYFSSTPLS